MDWQFAPDLQKDIFKLVKKLNFDHIDPKKIVAFRSFGSKSRARARIWSLPRIWQKALKVEPHYCIEVLSEKFDHLRSSEKKKILIHELLHIPKTFSGSLLPHRGRGRIAIDGRTVEKWFRIYKKQLDKKF
jgi:predicted metallopeptidase